MKIDTHAPVTAASTHARLGTTTPSRCSCPRRTTCRASASTQLHGRRRCDRRPVPPCVLTDEGIHTVDVLEHRQRGQRRGREHRDGADRQDARRSITASQSTGRECCGLEQHERHRDVHVRGLAVGDRVLHAAADRRRPRAAGQTTTGTATDNAGNSASASTTLQHRQDRRLRSAAAAPAANAARLVQRAGDCHLVVLGRALGRRVAVRRPTTLSTDAAEPVGQRLR